MVAKDNADSAAAWNGPEGDYWSGHWRHFDRSVAGHHRALVDAASIARSERVLDVGCGTGELSRAAGRAARTGSVLGVDLSGQMLALARRLSDDEELRHVSYAQADAQVHDFAPLQFDLVLSRFGVMFFSDPVAAWRNLRSALKPGGRLAMVAWRDLEANEWLRMTFDVLSAGRELPRPGAGSPGPLALADPSVTRQLLTTAGFHDVRLVPVDAPFWVGENVDDAYAWWSGMGVVRALTSGLSDVAGEASLASLRDTLAAHAGPDGVLFASGSWLVTARA
jgi:SAM-dependent methyltransferase